MADVLSSSAVEEPASTENPEILLRSLDDLLERYLNLLDAYQRAQQELTQHLSSGYISLAKANFSSPNRTRYGQDFYDGRMQATAKINIDETQRAGFLNFSMDTPGIPSTPKPTDSSSLPARQTSPTGKREDAPDSEAPPSETTSKVPSDPIKWFGMFAPQALRDAQSCFKSVISDVPRLANIAEEMRQVEAEVETLRGKLKTHEQT
ncbi:hypothetical protein MMC30_005861 [Trapelia coarctata]|nr:hypothetical protein [Trapelia coarctata]